MNWLNENAMVILGPRELIYNLFIIFGSKIKFNEQSRALEMRYLI